MKLVDQDPKADDEAEGPSDASLRGAFEQLVQREHPDGPAPGSRTRHFRFGISMLVLAVFTAVAGAYPLPSGAASRAMFLIFAIVLAMVGAYYIDRSTRQGGRPGSKDKGPTAPQSPRPHRVK